MMDLKILKKNNYKGYALIGFILILFGLFVSTFFNSPKKSNVNVTTPVHEVKRAYDPDNRDLPLTSNRYFPSYYYTGIPKVGSGNIVLNTNNSVSSLPYDAPAIRWLNDLNNQGQSYQIQGSGTNNSRVAVYQFTASQLGLVDSQGNISSVLPVAYRFNIKYTYNYQPSAITFDINQGSYWAQGQSSGSIYGTNVETSAVKLYDSSLAFEPINIYFVYNPSTSYNGYIDFSLDLIYSNNAKIFALGEENGIKKVQNNPSVYGLYSEDQYLLYGATQRQEGIDSSGEIGFFSLFKSVIQAPMYFIESAFNVELFGINLGAMIKSIVFLVVIAFVTSFVWKVVAK